MHSAEVLLQLIGEIKLSVIVNDSKEMRKEYDDAKLKLEKKYISSPSAGTSLNKFQLPFLVILFAVFLDAPWAIEDWRLLGLRQPWP